MKLGDKVRVPPFLEVQVDGLLMHIHQKGMYFGAWGWRHSLESGLTMFMDPTFNGFIQEPCRRRGANLRIRVLTWPFFTFVIIQE
jgi:hypothetical protein